MRVEFEYETEDRKTEACVWLLVKADVDLGTPTIRDRRPEHCDPGESPSAEVSVYGPDGERLTTEYLEANYTVNVKELRREAIEVAREDCR